MFTIQKFVLTKNNMNIFFSMIKIFLGQQNYKEL